MNAKINTNKPTVYAVYTNSIEQYEVIMETEKSYFVKKYLISGRYYETLLEKDANWVFTNHERAVEFLKNERNESKI